MSAEKLPKRYKAKELIKILNKGKIRDLTIGTPPQLQFDSSLEFRGEGATVKLATDDAALLKAYLAAKSTDNRTQHASQRCGPRWVFLILWRNIAWEN